MTRSHVVVLLAVLVGIPAGVGAFTFGYAKGFSYLSTDPRACVNCHIMKEQFDAWQKSGHRHVATCVDCHLPQTGLAKWIAKADEGFRHSSAFTLQNFKEPIEVTPGGREIILENCLRCHADLVESMHLSGSASDREIDCFHCHSTAGHGAGG